LFIILNVTHQVQLLVSYHTDINTFKNNLVDNPIKEKKQYSKDKNVAPNKPSLLMTVRSKLWESKGLLLA